MLKIAPQAFLESDTQPREAEINLGALLVFRQENVLLEFAAAEALHTGLGFCSLAGGLLSGKLFPRLAASDGEED